LRVNISRWAFYFGGSLKGRVEKGKQICETIAILYEAHQNKTNCLLFSALGGAGTYPLPSPVHKALFTSALVLLLIHE
jgi:hypothetical protein